MAEDNDANLRVCTFRLEQAGALIEPARNGEAIDLGRAALVAGRPHDAILIDLQMPVLDGYEATRRLHSLGYRGPILAVTAYAMPDDRDESLRVGCDARVPKPIAWPALLHLLVEHIGQAC